MNTRPKIYGNRDNFHLFVDSEIMSDVKDKSLALKTTKTELINDFIWICLDRYPELVSKLNHLKELRSDIKQVSNENSCLEKFKKWFKENELPNIKKKLDFNKIDVNSSSITLLVSNYRKGEVERIFERYIIILEDILNSKEKRELTNWINGFLIKLGIEAKNTDEFKRKLEKKERMELAEQAREKRDTGARWKIR